MAYRLLFLAERSRRLDPHNMLPLVRAGVTWGLDPNVQAREHPLVVQAFQNAQALLKGTPQKLVPLRPSENP